MEYYIVINEWNYPTNSGREFLGDYDIESEAEDIAKQEYEKEYDNFLDNVDGDIWNEGSGRMVNEYMDCEGYVLRSNQKELFFRSIIIKREVI